MRKRLKILICIFLLLVLSACGGRPLGNDTPHPSSQNRMPDIVFLYAYNDGVDGSEDELWIIDKEGKIYHTIDNRVENISTIREEYPTIESNGKWKLAGQIPADELKEQYEILKRISTSKNNIMHEVFNYNDDVCGIQWWDGYCYAGEENTICVSLYVTGDTCYYNENPRAEELADWMCDLMGIKKVYVFKKEDNSI